MSTNTQKGAAKPTSRKFAKSVIEIWLWGGPSQLETFDPKPDAPHSHIRSEEHTSELQSR